jgi:hypothetical protein
MPASLHRFRAAIAAVGFACCAVGVFLCVVTTTTPFASWMASIVASTLAVVALLAAMRLGSGRNTAARIAITASVVALVDDLSRLFR